MTYQPKHTPGPWIIGVETDETSVQIIAYDGSHLARVECDPLEANARLVAAAPELLDGLKSILESLRHGWSVETIHEARRIEMLIEKATGETP